MISLDIVTPEKRILTEDSISLVSVATTEGQIGILPGHIPLYSRLKAGELKYQRNGENFFVAIHGGFIEVAQNTVTILANDAVKAEDINEAEVEAARQRAADMMSQKISDEDFAHAEAALEKALLQLHVFRRQYSR